MKEILAIPLSRRPVFPGFMATITIKDEGLINSITSSINSGNAYVGLFLRNDLGVGIENCDVISDENQLRKVGTLAQIQNVAKRDGWHEIVVVGHRRITIDSLQSLGPPTIASISHWKKNEAVESSMLVRAYVNEVMQAIRDWVSINPLVSEQIQQWTSRVELSDPFKLADFAAAMTTANGEELQRILEEGNVESRLSLTLLLLNNERKLAALQKEISKQVETKLTKQQRDYFLREQLKSIKQGA